MVLAIVGSISLIGNLRAYHIIDEAITLRRGLLYSNGLLFDPALPLTVISGGAAGIDTMAIEVAMSYGLPFFEFLPDYHGWSAYKKRNLVVAKQCDELVRIVAKDTRTYGSGWTRDRAKELGKPTEEFIV